MIFKVLILLTFAVNLGCSVTVELYSGQNFSGLLRKVIVNEDDETECIRLDKTYEVRSLKTEKCVIVYETKECKHINAPAEGSKLYSIRVERNTALFDIDDAYSNRKEERAVQSFHVCDTEPFLNVDIYSGPFYTGDLVASYEAVCKCKNIPSYITLKGKEFSIDNHGKNMYFYDTEDCNGQPRLIPAGDNERSRSVTHLDPRAVVIRSFRPVDGLHCPNLDASVYKFSFSNEETITTDVYQNISYSTTNRQHTTVTEYFDMDYWVTAEYTVAKAFTYMHTSKMKAGFLLKPNTFVTAMLQDQLPSSLEAHYQYPYTNQNVSQIVTEESSFAPKAVIMPTCTTCTISTSVRKRQEYPLIYMAEAIVTGVSGDDKVSAEQIRHFLPPGMKYVKTNDDYSVVVTVKGNMKAILYNFASKEVSCTPLPNCETYSREDL